MIFLTTLEWSITKLAPHYIWQGTDEWFILPAEGEQHWYSWDWVFIHMADVNVEEVLVGVLIEIVVGLSIAVLIRRITETLQGKPSRIQSSLLTSTEYPR